MSGGRSRLNDRQELAIAALLTEPSHAAAAVKAGIGEATMTRWLRLPEFQAAYRASRRSLVEGTIASIQRASGEAVETLRAALSCENPSTAVRAAQVLLEYSLRGVEVTDLIERVEELERLAQEVENDGEPARPAGEVEGGFADDGENETPPVPADHVQGDDLR